MSTTTGADSALDLDAIEARVNVATEGPWGLRTGKGDIVTSASVHAGHRSILVESDGYHFGYADLADAEFIAHARTDVPTLVAEVRRLRPRVISGDVEAVTAALDGLPVGSIITCDGADDPDHDVALLTYQSLRWGSGTTRWYEVGMKYPLSSATIARHRVPITVLREGTGA